MRPPEKLGKAGSDAWARALRAVDGDDSAHDLCVAYACAVDRAAKARRAWQARGEQFTLVYSNGAEAIDPVLKTVVVAEKHVAALWRELRRSVKPRPANVDDLIDEILADA